MGSRVGYAQWGTNLFAMPEIDTVLAMSYLDFDSCNLNLSLFWYNPLLMHGSYRNTNPGLIKKI